jgi:vibriolysin
MAKHIDLRALWSSNKYRALIEPDHGLAETDVTSSVSGLVERLAGSSVRQVGEPVQTGSGGTTYRYQQLVGGIPVWGQTFSVRVDQTQIQTMNGTLLVDVKSTVKPAVAGSLDDQELAEKATALAAEQYGLLPEAAKVLSIERVIYAPRDADDSVCKKIALEGPTKDGGRTSPVYLVDEVSGETRYRFDNIQTFLPAGDVGEVVIRTALLHPTAFPLGTVVKGEAGGPGGNERTGRYDYGRNGLPGLPAKILGSGKYVFETPQVRTVDLNHGTAGDKAYKFSGPDNTHEPINGAFCPLNDAHFFGHQIFGMYQSWCGLKPLDGCLVLKVHYGTDYENAFWSPPTQTMYFGDGKTRFYPLVSLDVTAHEVSHGFTEHCSGLIYDGQSGGINEAFSDMAGEAAEFFMRGQNDFLVGADIFKKPDAALRYMADPPKDGRSIDSAQDFVDGMDVHFSSGVFNKAFYLLATKWGLKNAFLAFVEANVHYWNQNTDFQQGALGVYDAAVALSYNIDDVVAAFREVGIDIQPTVTVGYVDPRLVAIVNAAIASRAKDRASSVTDR